MPMVMLEPNGSNVGFAGFIVDFSLVKSCGLVRHEDGREGEQNLHVD